MTKLILIRHAESIANAEGITQGQKVDKHLTDLGKIQAKKTAERLKNEKVTLLISSDLKRALQTAEEISKIINKEIIIDKRLREKEHENETDEEFIKRCKDFLEDAKNYQGTIIVVAHGGTNRTLLAISTGDRKKGAELFNSVKQENAAINILEFRKNVWKILKINDISHLKNEN